MQMQPNQVPEAVQNVPQPQAEQAPQGPMDDGGDEGIVQGLEAHLNDISNVQKQFLADALQKSPDVVIPVLGIVCGQEVYDYFTQLYETHFKNSAPEQAPQQAMPEQNGPVMAPQSMPQNQSVMNIQPQAKATPSPMG